MDHSSLKLECLKLASLKSAHLGPEEVIAVAKKYEEWCLDLGKQFQGTPSVGNSQEPTDSVKEHKQKYSKKMTP